MVTFNGNILSVGDTLWSKSHRPIQFRVKWIREDEGMIDLVNVDPREWSDGQHIISRLEENFERHEMHPAQVREESHSHVMWSDVRNDVLPYAERAARDRALLHRSLDQWLDRFDRHEGDAVAYTLTHIVVE